MEDRLSLERTVSEHVKATRLNLNYQNSNGTGHAACYSKSPNPESFGESLEDCAVLECEIATVSVKCTWPLSHSGY